MNREDLKLLRTIVAESDHKVNACIHYPNCAPVCSNSEFRLGDYVQAQFKCKRKGKGKGAHHDATIIAHDSANDTFTLWFDEFGSTKCGVRPAAMSKMGCQGKCDACTAVARLITSLRQHDRTAKYPPPLLSERDVEMLRAYGLLPPIRLPSPPTTPSDAATWQRDILAALHLLRIDDDIYTLPPSPWVFRHPTNWISEAAIRLQREYLGGVDGVNARALFHELTHHTRAKQALCNDAARIPPTHVPPAAKKMKMKLKMKMKRKPSLKVAATHDHRRRQVTHLNTP